MRATHDPMCPTLECDFPVMDGIGDCLGHEHCEHHCQCALIARVKEGSVAGSAGDDSEDRPTWHPFVICPECREELDVPVNLTVTTNEDGSQFIDAEPDLTDVWAHAWTHEEKS